MKIKEVKINGLKLAENHILVAISYDAYFVLTTDGVMEYCEAEMIELYDWKANDYSRKYFNANLNK